VTTLSRVGSLVLGAWDEERFLQTSHRLLLPVLSGLCLFVSGALLVRVPGTLGLTAALAVVGLAGGAIASSFAYHRWRRAAPLVQPLSLPASPGGSPGPCPQCATPVPSLEWEDLFLGRFEARARATETAGPVRMLFTPTSASDQLWVHWLPAEVGQLPAALIGPIAASAYYPSESDDLTAAVTLRPTPDVEVRVGPTLATTDPSSEVERSFVLEVSPPPPLPPVPPPSRSPRATAVGAGSTADPSTETPLWMRSILAEALNPIPPHLRAGPAATLAPASSSQLELDLPGSRPGIA
jgi:hypothetical protein